MSKLALSHIQLPTYLLLGGGTDCVPSFGGVKLTSYLHTAPNLIMRGTILPLTYVLIINNYTMILTTL